MTNTDSKLELVSFPILAICGLFLLAGLAFGLHWFLSNFSATYNARKCERRIREKIGADRLQSWAVTCIQRGSVGSFPSDNTMQELEIILDQAPPWMGIVTNREVNPYVNIVWGGAGGHWGLWVGSSNFVVTSPSDTNSYTYHQWRPGMYFWEYFH